MVTRMHKDDERRAIDLLVKEFYSVFDNRGGRVPRLETLKIICLPACVVTRAAADVTLTCVLAAFIDPRAALLTSGELVEFSEEEEHARTELFGSVAQRVSTYRKSGVLRGEPYSGRGIKFMQFVRTDGDWRISSIAWEDERPGLEIPQVFPPPVDKS